MTETVDKLRDRVKAWYQEEALRVADLAADEEDLNKVDFEELKRRGQVLFACELAGLIEAEAKESERLQPGDPDLAQLERIAAAMRAQGKDVPEGIKKALGES